MMDGARLSDGPAASVSVRDVLDIFRNDTGKPHSESEEKRITRINSFMRELLLLRKEDYVTVRELSSFF